MDRSCLDLMGVNTIHGEKLVFFVQICEESVEKLYLCTINYHH